MANYEPDTFTENDVLAALDGAGLRHNNGQRYILSQCPTHEDVHPSTQIFKDDWFVNCLAGCGRFHITKAFPQLMNTVEKTGSSPVTPPKRTKLERQYKAYDLMEYWQGLPEIKHDFKLHNVPAETLNYMGWRMDGKDIFIPYFNGSKKTIPFSQTRHLTGDRRFTFLKDAKPTPYGVWNLFETTKIFLVEGASDAAVLEFCAIPWIAMPSASSTEMLKNVALYCKKEGIQIVYAGDNDDAGDALKMTLGEVMPFRAWQPPKFFKDWGAMLESEGFELTNDYLSTELMRDDNPDPMAWAHEAKRMVDAGDFTEIKSDPAGQ